MKLEFARQGLKSFNILSKTQQNLDCGFFVPIEM